MKCEWVRENITLHVYGELADDARHELDQHVARCTDCAAELKAAKEFHAALSQTPVLEPSPNLVTASRMRLQEALETAEQGRFWHRLAWDPANWLRQMGYKIEVGLHYGSDVEPYWSDAECIAVDAKGGDRLGASDGRGNGKAVGY